MNCLFTVRSNCGITYCCPYGHTHTSETEAISCTDKYDAELEKESTAE